MKICEGCIKQDVCKFKLEVEKWEESKKEELPCPLLPITECRYKETGQRITYIPCYRYPDVSIPTVWTDTGTTTLPWTTVTSGTAYVSIGVEGKDWNYTNAN